ncbi:MAG: hypothetical protein P1U54_04715 [Immundisolibacteraceae bacterium]|nr:hypothetical protein [Immundisolibacteraceae bacterium]
MSTPNTVDTPGAENLAGTKTAGHCLQQTPGRPAAPGQWDCGQATEALHRDDAIKIHQMDRP